MKELYIIGAGGHGAVVVEVALALGYQIGGFIDDDPAKAGSTVLNCRILGDRKKIPRKACIALGIGKNSTRAVLLEEALSQGWSLPVLVHPSAIISRSAELLPGTVVMPQAVVNARAIIGRACILNTSSSVDHDCILGDAVHAAPGTRLGGSVKVGACTLLGIGSCVLPAIDIGKDCTVGAGSAVIRPVPPYTTVAGVPARIIRR